MPYRNLPDDLTNRFRLFYALSCLFVAIRRSARIRAGRYARVVIPNAAVWAVRQFMKSDEDISGISDLRLWARQCANSAVDVVLDDVINGLIDENALVPDDTEITATLDDHLHFSIGLRFDNEDRDFISGWVNRTETLTETAGRLMLTQEQGLLCWTGIAFNLIRLTVFEIDDPYVIGEFFDRIDGEYDDD